MKNSSKILRYSPYALLSIVSYTMWYLIHSFVYLELNVTEWTTEQRGFMIFLSGVTTIVNWIILAVKNNR